MRTEAFPEPLIPVMTTNSGGRCPRTDDFLLLLEACFAVLFEALRDVFFDAWIEPVREDFRGFMQWIVASKRAASLTVVGADCDYRVSWTIACGDSELRTSFVSIPPRR